MENQLSPPSQTGPRTEAGKQVASKNALKHGCCALETLILPTESIHDFRAVEQHLRDAYDTPTEWELDLLNHAIEAEWFHIRATQTYARYEAGLYRTTPDPAEWTEAQHGNLARFLRYKTKHANDVAAHLKRLASFKRVISQRAPAPQPASPPQPGPLPQPSRSEKLALLGAMAQHGLVRWQDLDGVFLPGDPAPGPPANSK